MDRWGPDSGLGRRRCLLFPLPHRDAGPSPREAKPQPKQGVRPGAAHGGEGESGVDIWVPHIPARPPQVWTTGPAHAGSPHALCQFVLRWFLGPGQWGQDDSTSRGTYPCHRKYHGDHWPASQSSAGRWHRQNQCWCHGTAAFRPPSSHRFSSASALFA